MFSLVPIWSMLGEKCWFAATPRVDVVDCLMLEDCIADHSSCWHTIWVHDMKNVQMSSFIPVVMFCCGEMVTFIKVEVVGSRHPITTIRAITYRMKTLFIFLSIQYIRSLLTFAALVMDKLSCSASSHHLIYFFLSTKTNRERCQNIKGTSERSAIDLIIKRIIRRIGIHNTLKETIKIQPMRRIIK